MSKTVYFYSSVKTKKMFSVQKFYRTDIEILKKLGYRVKLSNAIVDFLNYRDYDVAFIYFYRYGFLPALIAKFFKKKVIFTGGIDYLNREYAGMKSYMIQKILFLLCQYVSDRTILVSNADKNNIKIFKKKLQKEKYPLSFHVIDFEKYKYTNEVPKEKIITTIAWMLREENIYRKGVDKAIKTFNEFIKLEPEYKLFIIGPIGSETKVIKDLIEQYGLNDKVILTDSISEKKKIEILKKSKFYLQLSSYEGFGIAAIEALASGNIVIHSGKGGLTDGVADKGILIDNIENYTLIAKKINELKNSDVTKKINDGIKHVEQNFNYTKRQNDLKKILQSIS